MSNAPWGGPWVLVNAWSIFDRSSELPPGDYTGNPGHPFNVVVDAMVERLYVGLNPALRRAAGRSVLAHLIDLIGRDIVASEGPATVETRYRLRHIARPVH